MNNHHYGFFTSKANDLFNSVQGVVLLSLTSDGGKDHLTGRGTYMYLDNFRRSISLFSIRSLVKSTWINSNDVYIGEPK